MAHLYMMSFFDDGEPRSDLTPTATAHTLQASPVALVVGPLSTDVNVGLIQIDVVAAARTYTKTVAVSWSADGFAVGDWITFAAFANSGNNTTGKIESITGASSEILTLENRPTLALVNETGSGNEQAIQLVAGAFFASGSMAAAGMIAWDAGVALIGDSRHKHIPAGPGQPYIAEAVLGASFADTLFMVAGSVGEAIRAAAATLYTRMEQRTFGSVNNKKVVNYIETVYYTDGTFATEVLRLEHTPTYDATSAVLEATSNEKA